MLFKTKLKLGMVISLLVVIIGGFYLHKTQKHVINEDIADIPKPVQQEKENVTMELIAQRGKILENLDALKGVTIKHGKIEINSKASVEKLEVASSDITEAELAEKVLGRDYDYVVVSITNTSDMRISSSTPEYKQGLGQNEMIVMENMGLPQGVDFRAQSVKSMAQEGLKSEELKILEEKQLKRKSNFARSLEKREARKALYKDRL